VWCRAGVFVHEERKQDTRVWRGTSVDLVWAPDTLAKSNNIQMPMWLESREVSECRRYNQPSSQVPAEDAIKNL
jgi:hypothetical protein